MASKFGGLTQEELEREAAPTGSKFGGLTQEQVAAGSKFGGLTQEQVAADTPGRSVNYTDLKAWEAGRKASTVSRKDMLAMTPEEAKLVTFAAERGARSTLHPDVVDQVLSDQPSLHRGATSSFQRAADFADFTFSVPGLAKLFARGASWAPAAVSRPLFSGLSVNYDVRGLARKDAKEREKFVADLDNIDRGKPLYGELASVMGELEVANPNATPERIAELTLLDSRASGTLASLYLQYLSPSFKSGFGERDPYGGNYPRPTEDDIGPDGLARTKDAMDVVSGGLFGLDEGQAQYARKMMRPVSSALGKGFREATWGAMTSPPARAAAEFFGAPPAEEGWAQSFQGLRDNYNKMVEEGDTAAGMGFFNMVAMVAPDLFIPSGKALDLVDTNVGMLTRQGAKLREAEKIRSAGKAVEGALSVLGRELKPAEANRLMGAVNVAVDSVYSTVAKTAKKPVGNIDVFDALEVGLRDGALVIKNDMSKVVVTSVELGPGMFPKAAPIPRALGVAGAKVLGQLPGGDHVLRLAEGSRRVFGLNEPLMIKDKVAGGWRRPQPTDAIGEHQWQAFRSIVTARSGAKAEVKAEIDKAIGALFKGSTSPQERAIIGKFAEVLGNPDVTAAKAGDLFNMLQEKISKGLKATPAIVDDLARRQTRAEKSLASAEKRVVAAEAHKNQRQAAADLAATHQAAIPSLEGAVAAAKAEAAEATKRVAKAVDAATGDEAVASAQRHWRKASAAARTAQTKLDDGVRALERAAKKNDTAAMRAAEEELLQARSAFDQATAAKEAVGGVVDDAMALSGFQQEVKAAKAEAEAARAALKQAKSALQKAPSDQRVLRLRASLDNALAKDKAAAGRLLSAEQELDDAAEAFIRAQYGPSALPSAPTLGTVVESALQIQAARAHLVAEIMESVTGSRSAKAAQARAELGRELREIGDIAQKAANRASTIKALDGLTVADAKQATRALRRLAKDPKLAAEWKALSPEAKKVVEHIRKTMDDMYDRLKAAGRLNQSTKEDLYERMLVEGYLPHMLSKRGRKKMAARLREGGLQKGELSTAMDSLKGRDIQGAGYEINERMREAVAEMLWDQERVAGKGIAGETRDMAVDRIIDKHGLMDDVYFQQDPASLLAKYGQDTAAGLANTAMVRDLINLFPEGDKFVALLPGQVVTDGKSLKAADEAAKAAGYRRVDRMSLLRTMDPKLVAWDGWSKHGETLNRMIDAYDPAAVDNLLNELRRHGAPIDAVVDSSTRAELRKPVYMPFKVADELELLGRKSLWAGIPDGIRSYLREYTSVWKMAMTVLAPAFHGRNWLSNMLQSYMVNGWDAVKPSTQINAHKILTAADDTLVNLGFAEKTAAAWREEMRLHGVITDHIGFTDEGVSTLANKIDLKRGMKAYAAGGAVGAASGVVVADNPEDRARFAMWGALAGAAGAGALSANLDAFGRDAMDAVAHAKRAGKTPRGIMRDGYEAVLTDTLIEAAGKSQKVGTVSTLLGMLWGSWGGEVLETAGTAGLGATAFTMVAEAGGALAGGVGRHIEDVAKISNAIAEGAKGGGMDAMAHAAHRATFDYSNLTYIEREVFKLAFPFWSWRSKNIALQAWMMVNRPKRYNLVEKTMRSLWSDEDAWAMDDHMGNRWLLSVGVGRILAGAATAPEAMVEEVTKGFRGAVSSLHPVLKDMWELARQEDSFYGIDLMKNKSGSPYKTMPAVVKDSVGYRDDVLNPRTGQVMGPQIGWYKVPRDKLAARTELRDPVYAAAIMETKDGAKVRKDMRKAVARHKVWSSHPTRRVLMELNKTLVESFTSGVSIHTPTAKATFPERALNLTTGFKARQVEPITIQSRLWDRMKALSDAQEAHGNAYQTTSLPKLPQAPEGFYLE